jgi:UDP-2,4-diacetamido-2,4,6-trideoxy-beta-L-altropyranose hydrolase
MTNVLIRADAAPSIGGGHVMRCLALAGALVDRGAQVTFLSRAETLATVPHLARSGFRVAVVEGGEADLVMRLETERAGATDLVIIDSYALGAEDETRFRRLAKRIAVIDDLANRLHDCDVLLDHNLGRTPEDYCRLVPPHATVLAGPRYALLRPEFARLRYAALARRAASGRLERLLVSLGLTDLGGITGEVVGILLAADLGLTIDVVVGPQAESLPYLQAVARDNPHLAVHVDPPDIASIMAAADLAVGAAGSSSWERCCLGLPTVIVVLAGNQEEVATKLEQANIARRSSPAMVCSCVRELMNDIVGLRRIVTGSAAMCDGGGTDRVARILLACCKVGLRQACPNDSRFLLDLRNEPTALAMSHNPDVVSEQEHSKWFMRQLSSPHHRIHIVEIQGRAVGVFRLDREGDRAVASINLVPDARHGGIGTASIALGCEIALSTAFVTRIDAVIKVGNEASAHAFAKAGFVEYGTVDGCHKMVLEAKSAVSARQRGY